MNTWKKRKKKKSANRTHSANGCSRVRFPTAEQSNQRRPNIERTSTIIYREASCQDQN
jgi:hypothetical protein